MKLIKIERQPRSKITILGFEYDSLRCATGSKWRKLMSQLQQDYPEIPVNFHETGMVELMLHESLGLDSHQISQEVEALIDDQSLGCIVKLRYGILKIVECIAVPGDDIDVPDIRTVDDPVGHTVAALYIVKHLPVVRWKGHTRHGQLFGAHFVAGVGGDHIFEGIAFHLSGIGF